MNADQYKNIPVLDKFKCRQCGIMKPNGHFSNKELNGYRYQKVNNRTINAITARLRCRVCAGSQVHELQCEGPCGLWKSLDEFSKAQRTRGSKWCMICVNWKDTAEPGVVPGPPPNSDLAPDEDDEFFGPQATSDPEGEADSDSWNSDGESNVSDTSAPYIAMTAMTISGAASTANESIRTTSTAAPLRSSATASYLPPHLRNFPNLPTGPSSRSPTRSGTGATNSQSGVALSQSGPSGYVPPHLRNVDTKSQSSMSNPYGSEVGNTGSNPASWSNLANGRPGQFFNAYDPSGQRHLKQHIPSTTDQSSTRSDNVSSRTPSNAPQPETAGDGKWARPNGSRKTPKPRFTTTRPVQQRGYDSDESPDEI